MAIRSEAQRRKLQRLVAEGQFAPETYAQWEHATAGQELPERVTTRAPSTDKLPSPTKGAKWF